MITTAPLAILLAACICAPMPAGAADGRKAFVESWQGSTVVVQRTLYTLVYDERGKLGKIYRGKREGLAVVTPNGVFFRFDGRDSEPDVTGRSPQEVVDQLGTMYQRSKTLDIGSFQRIQPSVVTRYEPGAQLVVRRVRIEKDRIRVVLGNQAAGDSDEQQVATMLTVQWPTQLSESFGERAEIEMLLAQFIAGRPK